MAWVIGIDEAGYGPNLGPFVMTAVACRVPDPLAGANLWQLLRSAVRNGREQEDGRLLVDDSKVVYSTARGLLGLERSLADELGLGEVDQAAEADLERRVGLLGDHRVAAARVVDLQQDQPRLEADHVERDHPGGADPEVGPRVRERVPHRDGVLRRDPHLVAEVAGVAGPRDVDRDLPDAAGTPSEVPEIAPRRVGGRLEHVAAQRPLDGECRDLLGHVLDLDVQPA